MSLEGGSGGMASWKTLLSLATIWTCDCASDDTFPPWAEPISREE